MPKAKKQAGAAASDALADLRDKLAKKFGKDAALIPADDETLSGVKGVVPCGIDVVDRYVYGNRSDNGTPLGGAPLSKVMEVFSEPGVGKTAWLWSQLAGCVRMGGLAIYCDNEHSYDAHRAKLFGLPPDRFLLLQPWTLEEALSQMTEAVKGLAFDGPVLMGWDSLGGSQYEGDLKSDFNKLPQDTRALDVHRFCRSMVGETGKRALGLIIVNQTRHKRGVMFGSDITTPGGDGPKFAAALRVQLFGGKALKNKVGQHVGKSVTFLAVKTRFSAPFRKAKVRLDYEKGWDNGWSTINLAKDLELIPAGLEVCEATYARAVEAFGWKDAAPWVEAASSTGDDVTDDDDGLTGESD